MSSNYDPYQKYAYVDVTTGVLQAWGYFDNNCRPLAPVCDKQVLVPWDFELPVQHWRYDESVTPPVWVPYP